MKQIIPIKGMHCESCTIRIKSELMKVKGVHSAKVSLQDRQAVIECDKSTSDYDLDVAVRRAGYTIGTEKPPLISKDPRDYKLLVGGIVIVLALLFLASKLEDSMVLFERIYNNDALYAIIMGLVAGFSTCMALVGGLVVSAGALYKKHNPKATKWQSFQPNIFFNLGRISGFIALGALLGLLGSAFTFSTFATGIVTLLAGVLMLLIGVQLTGLFPRLTAITLPAKLSEKLGLTSRKDKTYSHRNALILGALSFFLPCGFTQAMQLFAISTGSAMSGALVMGLFALGTTPGLLAIGGATSIISGKKRQTFLKIVGVVVVGLAFVNINSGFNLTGFKLPEFSLPSMSNTSKLDVPEENIIRLNFADSWRQFDQKELVLRPNEAYRIEIMPENDGLGCMGTVTIRELPGYRPRLLKANQLLSFEFETTLGGTYTLICAMGVPFDTTIRLEA